MRFRFAALSLLVATAYAVSGAFAEQRPNLTGTWKLNLDQSKLSDGKPITYYTEFVQEIEHRDPSLRIVEKIKAPGSDRTVTWNLTTDGKETDADMSGSPGKISATWEGNQLVTRIAAENWKVVRTYTMGPDGKSITAAWVLEQEGDSVRATELWERQ